MKRSIFFWTASITLFLGITSCVPQPVDKDGTVKATYVHKYGVEVDDARDWQERGASGKVVKHLKNGETQIESWQDGKLHGLTTLSFPHSEVVKRERFFDAGTLIWSTDHYRSGIPQRQLSYEPGKCTVSTWYEDASPKSLENLEGAYLITGNYFTQKQELESQIANGKGERIVRDGYGQLQKKEVFVDGLLREQITYHANSMPKCVIPYHEGVIAGTKKTFLPDGGPATVEEWANNQPNGITILYENGEKVAEVPFVNGAKQGVEKRFRPGTTQVVEEITWREDTRHGPTIASIQDKKITEWYHEGTTVSRSQFLEQND